MLGFVQNWFAPEASPIGVDFGADSLRLAQVDPLGGGDFRLSAAANAQIPFNLRNDPAGRLKFFSDSIRPLLKVGHFRGRRAVLNLPAASMYIQQLRMPRMDEEARLKELNLRFDPDQTLLRHLVAGPVKHESGPQDEIIVMAARRDLVDQLLEAAADAKLDVIGMNLEPKAIVDCFCHVYRRKNDSDVTNCFVDMGCSATRAIVARGSHILFARVIPIGGDDFGEAVASALGISLEDARILRIKECHVPAGRERSAKEPLDAPTSAPTDSGDELESDLLHSHRTSRRATSTEAGSDHDRAAIQKACAPPLATLIEELSRCRQYHETNFPDRMLDRLVFVGGEARHRGMCQKISRELNLPAQVGDPLVRMGRVSSVGVESGLDRRLPQPAWSIALGLSMGPTSVPDPVLSR